MKNPAESEIRVNLARNLTKIFQENIAEFELDYVSSGIFENPLGFELLLVADDSDDVELIKNAVERVVKVKQAEFIGEIQKAMSENGEKIKVSLNADDILLEISDFDCEDENAKRVEISVIFNALNLNDLDEMVA